MTDIFIKNDYTIQEMHDKIQHMVFVKQEGTIENGSETRQENRPPVFHTLSAGNHTLAAFFEEKDGEETAQATLNIAAAEPTPAPTDVPKTGDSAMPPLWLGLILLGLNGLCGAGLMKTRK